MNLLSAAVPSYSAISKSTETGVLPERLESNCPEAHLINKVHWANWPHCHFHQATDVCHGACVSQTTTDDTVNVPTQWRDRHSPNNWQPRETLCWPNTKAINWRKLGASQKKNKERTITRKTTENRKGGHSQEWCWPNWMAYWYHVSKSPVKHFCEAQQLMNPKDTNNGVIQRDTTTNLKQEELIVPVAFCKTRAVGFQGMLPIRPISGNREKTPPSPMATLVKLGPKKFQLKEVVTLNDGTEPNLGEAGTEKIDQFSFCESHRGVCTIHATISCRLTIQPHKEAGPLHKKWPHNGMLQFQNACGAELHQGQPCKNFDTSNS